MPFSQRNIFYLRTSPHVVLQTILYLDPRDLRWMNSNAYNDDRRDHQMEDDYDIDEEADERCTGEFVWSRALSKLRGKIMPKLRAESIEGEYLSTTNKKEKVDVHIEADFQMAYFFRKVSGKHAVLLKEKELKFPTAAAPPSEMPPPMMSASAMSKVGNTATDIIPLSRLANRQLNQKDNVLSQGSRIANVDDIDLEEDVKSNRTKRTREEEEDGEASNSNIFSQSIRVKQEDDDDEVQLVENMPVVQQEAEEINSIDVDAMEDDKKPRLHVKYSGFRIFGKCLIIVIEPTKRTKRLRSSLFQTSVPVEMHQLSATPVPRQARETPRPSSSRPTPNRRTRSVAPLDDDMAMQERSDSRRDRLSDGLFRGTPSDWTPTPTPEPERRNVSQHQSSIGRESIMIESTDDEEESGNPDESSSVMLATQMLEGGIAGQGNDIDDE